MELQLSDTDRQLIQTLLSVVADLKKEVNALRQERTGEVLYTVEQCAEILRVSPRTVRLKIKNGLLHASKAGKEHWITAEELTRYRQSAIATVDQAEANRIAAEYRPKKKRSKAA